MSSRIKSIKTKKPGKVLTSKDIKSYLDGQLFQVAKEIKEYILTLAQAASKHPFRKDGQGSMAKGTSVDFNTDGVVIHLPQHAYYLDVGRRAFAKKVPISALIGWIKRYRILGRDAKSGKFKKTSKQSVNSLAFAIQNAIYKTGLKARNFIKPSIEFAEQALAEAIDKMILPAVMTTVEFALKKSTR